MIHDVPLRSFTNASSLHDYSEASKRNDETEPGPPWEIWAMLGLFHHNIEKHIKRKWQGDSTTKSHKGAVVCGLGKNGTKMYI